MAILKETNVYKQKAAEMWLRLKKLERARSKCPRHQEQNCDEIMPEEAAAPVEVEKATASAMTLQEAKTELLLAKDEVTKLDRVLATFQGRRRK